MLPAKPNAALDWSLLRSFLAVVEHGSLLAAAASTGVSQPTLGRHIDALETQLGVSLFERSGRGLQPTQAAQLVVPHVMHMAASADALMLSLQHAASAHNGTVRLSCSRAVAAFCIPPLLAELRSEQAHIQIEIVASDEQSNLLRREADIALRMVRPNQQGLIAKKLGDMTMGAFAHKRYLALRGTPRSAQDLLTHTLLGFDANDAVIKGFASNGLRISPAQFALRTDDAVTYWEALRSGCGIGFITSHLAKRDLSVVQVLPELQMPSLPIWLTTHREVRGNANIRWVYDFLAQRFMSTVV